MPSELIHDSPRVAAYSQDKVELARQDGVDLLEEARELALSRSAYYQQNLRRYHKRRVRGRVFQEGDLVLRLVQRTYGIHKLSAPWEGPFIISKVLHNGAYYLIDMRPDKNNEETERPWNISQLRPFYT